MFMDGWTDRRLTDARLIAISPEPFGRGIKKAGGKLLEQGLVSVLKGQFVNENTTYLHNRELYH